MNNKITSKELLELSYEMEDTVYGFTPSPMP